MGSRASYGSFLADDSRYLAEGMRCGIRTGIPSGLTGDRRYTGDDGAIR